MNRARRQPDDIAYTFIDYEVNPSGFAESLTWSQLAQRARIIARELLLCASIGDRAAILAPQGLDYIVAFYGAMQAGLIAVPLPAPQFGGYDERVSGALEDCSPAVLLTTSAVVAEVLPYAGGRTGAAAPRVIEIDALDFDSPLMADVGLGPYSSTAYLQYTSGSTRRPAGVVVTHQNVLANLGQIFADYFEHRAKVPPSDITFVSWLPFFHDMGMVQGVFAPLLVPSAVSGETVGRPAFLMSPVAFLQRPARWMQLLAVNSPSWSAAPNFAFELAARRTSDEDMAGLDLGGVLGIISGSERIHAATIQRFNDRFSRFGLPSDTVRPSYGLAEATLYVTSAPKGHAPARVRFDYEKLAAGYAVCSEGDGATELVNYGPPRASTVRIVDPETRAECPASKVGEIWVHGDNVAGGYWRNRELSQRTFGVELVNPSPGTPRSGWLRTGDLGVMSQGELLIIGRIKDLLIVDGRNHYPDDIEATIQEVTGRRVAAIAIPDGRTERLVVIAEIKNRGEDEETLRRLQTVKREVITTVSQSHSVRVADLVLVAPGSIPITTSGKVRRSACAERYRGDGFLRLDVGL
ncbi:long-chain-fatty-acid--AMP ligase FadD26 [Mycolicibacterium agri]|nr:long-chain-fatty-acid--AMP ligase FadD26 [Mycolicibacterium agri]